MVSAAAAFIEKQLQLHPPTGSANTGVILNITRITLFDQTAVSSGDAPPTSSITASSKYSAYGLGDYAVFHRFGTKQGVFISAQNPYLTLTERGQ